jgi:protocatechuate 3,4-dioxygenase beta subunit
VQPADSIRWGAVAIALAAAAFIVEAQQTTVVRGRVVSADDSTVALRGARVSIAGNSAADPVFTDAGGRFEISLAGPAPLKVIKAGFAPGFAIAAVAPGEELRIAMARGAVVSGAVLDELGFPVADARVRVALVNPSSMETMAGLTVFATDTNDAGEYRIGSLPAGRYQVHTQPQVQRMNEMAYMLLAGGVERVTAGRGTSTRSMSNIETIDIRAGQEGHVVLAHTARAVSHPDDPIAGALSGQVVDEYAEPMEGVTVRAWRLRYVQDRYELQAERIVRDTDDLGRFRLFGLRPGRYLISATLADASLAPIYFPGVAAVAQAVPVVIGRNQDITGQTIAFVRTPAVHVTGLVVDSRGEPMSAALTLTSAARGGVALPMRRIRSESDGRFVFGNVGPGEYMVRATGAAGPAGPQQVAEFAAARLVVGGGNLEPITLATQPTATVFGRIVLEGDSAGVPPTQFAVMPVPDRDIGPTLGAGGLMSGDQFELRGLAGPTRVRLSRAPAGWWLKSAEIGVVNAAEQPVTLAGPDDSRRDAIFVISATAGSIGGRVRDDAGRPAPDYRALVFSTNPARWFAGSPWVKLGAGPESDDGFSVRSLPPGDYFVVAVDAIDGDDTEGEWQNPEVLTTLAASATRVTVRERQRTPIELRLTRWER